MLILIKIFRNRLFLGHFLKLLKDFGCNAYGVEINNIRMAYVKNKLKINCHSNINTYKIKLKFKKFSILRIGIYSKSSFILIENT